MNIQKLLDGCHDAMAESIWDAIQSDKCYAFTDYETPSCSIEMEMHRNGTCNVVIYHEDKVGGCPLLVQAIEDAMPDWNDIQEEMEEDSMDEWQANGFRDEADFWRWKEGWR